jgi:hypothetical protein
MPPYRGGVDSAIYDLWSSGVRCCGIWGLVQQESSYKSQEIVGNVGCDDARARIGVSLNLALAFFMSGPCSAAGHGQCAGFCCFVLYGGAAIIKRSARSLGRLRCLPTIKHAAQLELA